MGKVISIVNSKGGVGKTAVTVNLGVGLARSGKKVLLIDADTQSNLSASLGYREMDDSDETLSELIYRVMKDERIPEDLFIRHQQEGVDVITSNINLAAVEAEMINAMSREYMLKQLIAKVRDKYDYILIDNMPSLGMIIINSLAVADEVIIPVEASYLSLKGIQHLFKTIGLVKRQINPDLKIGGIVFSIVDMRTREAKDNMRLLTEAYGNQIKIYRHSIPASVRMRECCKVGLSIFNYEPKGKAAEAYEGFTEEVLAYDC